MPFFDALNRNFPNLWVIIMKKLSVLVERMTHAEGPRWHAGRFWFSDLYSASVYSMREDGSDLRTELKTGGSPVSGIGWLPDGRLLAVSMLDRQLLRREHDGSVAVHADLAPFVEFIPNDMVVDALGRAWVGNFGFDIFSFAPRRPARLVRVDPDGTVTPVSEPLHFPNGCIVSADTLVVAESLGNRLSAFDIQPDGSLSPRRDWATFGPVPRSDAMAELFGEIAVAADGISQMDAEGAIWVADFIKPRAIRVRPGGEIVDAIDTGERNCYACALGGADGRTLILCTTPPDFNPEVRRNDPQSCVFAARVDVPVV